MERHEFQPKEWVLARDYDEQKWKLDIFTSYVAKDDFPYKCIGNNYVQCIPYDGNESLLNEKDAPEKQLAKDLNGLKVGDKVEVEYDSDKKWYDGEIVRIDPSRTNWFDDEKMPYYVRSGCFKYNDGCAWCATRQLRKPGERPEKKEFKFGDKVKIRMGNEWCEAVVIEVDHSDIPYKVATADGDIHWRRRGDVRRA